MKFGLSHARWTFGFQCETIANSHFFKYFLLKVKLNTISWYLKIPSIKSLSVKYLVHGSFVKEEKRMKNYRGRVLVQLLSSLHRLEI